VLLSETVFRGTVEEWGRRNGLVEGRCKWVDDRRVMLGFWRAVIAGFEGIRLELTCRLE
jgi:hypothetical protein